MFTSADFREISRAIETKQALGQIRDRAEGLSPSSSLASGQLFRPSESESKFELATMSNRAFMGDVIGQGKVFNLSPDVAPGSLLSYTDKASGQTYYGQVSKIDAVSKKIEVENISSDKAKEIQAGNPATKTYELRSQDIAKSKSSSIVKTLMSLLDPSENLLFKLLTMLLVGNLTKADSVADIFIGVYLRIVGLAVTIIAIMYLSTIFLG